MARDIAKIATQGCVKRTSEPLGGRRTSANKQKSLGVDERERIHEALAESSSEYAAWVMLLLEGGRIAGLRPIEWPGAWLEGSQESQVLRVSNAKNSNGRTHGPSRTLILGGLSEQEREVIEHLLEAVSQADRDWSSIYSGSRKLLHRITRRIWPRRRRYPTLYSARHQFAADAKAAGLSRAEVAALMGHGTDRTAGEHYGRGSSGNGGFRIAAVQAEVERVRATARQRPAPAPAQPPTQGPTP
jgi:integrase